MKPNNSTSLLTDDRFHLGMPVRRGLTLTEILAATFVLSFGLVAALTVLPFATFQLNRMNVADSSSACGRGAIQQIRMAEWYKPDVLHYNWEGNVPADPYIVDPLGIIDPDTGTVTSSPQTFAGGDLYAFTLADPFTLVDALNLADASRHFRWGDDTVFASDDLSVRPTLVSNDYTTAGLYTWMYMVTPVIDPQPVGFSRSTPGSIATAAPDDVLGYEVAAVVFNRRDTAPNATRRVTLSSTTPPIINATGAYISLQSGNPDELDLSTIKWLLLTSDPSVSPDRPINAQWYRITGYDDIMYDADVSDYVRRVFLVGPDWKGAKDANDVPLGISAILCDGVVNVFQATMPK
ncbi:MAG: hypothetical protein FWH27_16300 [Planctomycetaceae bacterium]|nr:hypothetical protein [Planctomycetaceae bacterium]